MKNKMKIRVNVLVEYVYEGAMNQKEVSLAIEKGLGDCLAAIPLDGPEGLYQAFKRDEDEKVELVDIEYQVPVIEIEDY